MEEYNYTYKGSEDYCYPGTSILKNKLGLKEDSILLKAEREITSIKLLMLYNMPVEGLFNFDHFCNIHKIIFEDIYEWAGKIRKGEFLTKGNSIFCRGQYLKENADKIFTQLKDEKILQNLPKNNFIKRLAYYMGEVNALHPFREGNGRTSREYFRQLSLNANYILDFSKTNKNELLLADIEAFNGSYENLIKILAKSIKIK
ncbi:Fic protein family [Treponema primitia ZAS-2]|uniref:protein adenylyltransferase n=1 Tax=Treponema primitia (strain ATCC BAA-887 / DSM 12427 / ZAS-2) TaxID=545694 RepID=F5YJ34_TREPZ|nr:Fic family protein [Treponema primitia]AEF84631.1 Fic protein family [Treponema primitia ZAS-2]